MDNIFIWAPIIFGAAIGWLIVYFTRKFSDFTADSLMKVAGVSIGGTGFCSLTFIESTEIGSKVIMFYLLGIGIGFFVHWIYQIIISLSLKDKFYNHRDLYDLFSGCSIKSEEDPEGFRLHRKAEKIVTCYKQWDKGRITEDEFKTFVKDSGITKAEFESMIDEDREYLLLDDETIIVIKAKGLDSYFKD